MTSASVVRAADIDEVQARSKAGDEMRIEAERERALYLEETRSGFRLEVVGGYGYELNGDYLNCDIYANGLGAGVGARAGYLFPFGFYLGGSFTYHFGGSAQGPACHGQTVVTATVTGSNIYFGPEFGYEASLGRVSLRPYIGTSFLISNQSGSYADGTPISSQQISLALTPALAAFYNADRYFFGLDARMFTTYGVRTTAFDGGPTILADIGVRF
jgi:hypothetical protein